MPIYNRSTGQILIDYIHGRLKGKDTIEKAEILDWFAENYPKIKQNTISAHIGKFTTNYRSRIHHKVGSKHDLLFKLPNGQYRLYDPETDPKPIYSADDLSEQLSSDSEEEYGSAFAYESHLRDFLANSLHIIEDGLELYADEEDETITGIEYDAGGRFIDLLAQDKVGNFVVIELKLSKGYEKAIGQLLRYKAWVRNNLSNGKPVRGIVIAKEMTDDIKLAATELNNIELFEYDLKVELRKVKI